MTRSIFADAVMLFVVAAAIIPMGCSRPKQSPAKSKPATIEGEKATITKPTAGLFADETIIVDGKQREFRLFVPRGVDLKQPMPLVVAFHGMLIDGKDVMPWYTRLEDLAAEKKFILVFPEAVEKSWGISPSKVSDDLAFFDALVKDVDRRYTVDAARIYVLGMSNGGYFAHLVGKERSRSVAAVCSHSGPLGLQTLLGVHARRKFPVMIVHGDQDIIFSVDVARENRDKYRRENHFVEYVEVRGLGHEWATRAGVNDRIWMFFEANPLKK